jgi:ADP-L-glycero-D-manno-heptose 6-epimerase
MVRRLQDAGYADVLAVDDFSRADKAPNLAGKQLAGQVHRNNFVRWMERNHADVTAVIHLGARTDTTEQSRAIFDELNVEYSRALWMLCSGFQVPFLYASSAATYGLGEQGYSDAHAGIPALRPLNPYGQSKQDFDLWVLETLEKGGGMPPNWAGFKFFNVYGPNEYHKGRMASVIFHTARQIKQNGRMNLFRSHRPDYADGAQSRDFIYVKDVVDVLLHFLEKRPENGIYNLGTGKARSFLDLAKGTFAALGLPPEIGFVDTPADIRDTYQYFTEADMSKLRRAGYKMPFYGLEEGIADYVQRYLRTEQVW